MSEVSIGDITARIRADTTDFTRGLQTALQSLAQFQQTLAGMQAPLGHVQQGLQRMPQQATPAFQQLNQTITQTVTVFNTLTTNITQARTQAEGFGQSWRAIFQIAGGIGLATTITGIVSALKEFATEAVQVATRLESLRNSLGALAGSTAAGRQQFNDLFQTAQQLGVAFEPLGRGWRQLTAAATLAGVPLDDQRRLLTALTTEGRRVGASNEELSRSITALSQMASKGKISMEELRQQLGEALPTAMAAAARGMGRTTEELDKLIETGSIRFPSFARALTRGFEELQQGSGAIAEGAQQAFNRLGNALTAFKDALGQNILPELQRIARVTQTILEGATRFLNFTGGRTGGPVGPSLGDLGATSAQQQEEARLQARIVELQHPLIDFSPGLREAEIGRVTEQLAALRASVRVTVDQAAEQGKVTAEANKTKAALDLQRDTLRDIVTQMDLLGKAQEEFRRKAALTPALSGRPGGTLEEQKQFQQGMQQTTRPELEKLATSMANLPAGVVLPAETVARLREIDQGYGRLGQALDTIKDKQQAATRAARDDEQARLKEIRDQEQEQKQRIQGLARDLDIFGLTLSPEQEADLKTQVKAQHERMQEFAKRLDIFGLDLSPEQERQRRAGTAFDQRLQAAIEQQQAARAQRPEVRLRAEATREGLTLTPEREGQLGRLTALREEQERLNEATRIYEEMAGRIGDAFTGALTSIADHTKSVSAAFRDMGRSIMQSLAQTAASEGWKQLISIGAGLITQYFGGGNTATASQAAATIAGFRAKGYAEGGVVTRPTLAMLGENPATSPEIVMNRQQMQQFIASATRAAPTAGGQAAGSAGISIINVTSTEEAQRQKSQQESMGRQVVLNYIMDDLSQGNGSKINRAISTLQR